MRGLTKKDYPARSRADRVWLYDSARKVTAHVVSVVARKAGIRGSILDVGCGHGLLANYIAAEIGLAVTGVDSNPALVAVAARSDVTGTNTFLVGDAADLPVTADSFQMVTCIEVLEHVDDPKRVLAEIRRALVPGGWLILSTPNEQTNPFAETTHSEHKQHFTIAALLASLGNAGFVIAWSGYRYHAIGAAIDRILLRVGPRVVQTTELDEHTTAVPTAQRFLPRVILTIYQWFVDPVVERLVIREFTLRARRPGASLFVIARRRLAG
jgi:2-polyprenyl-3-methyl-5-hydroxy-6-metoxy-1,4-benzoquinol methylase